MKTYEALVDSVTLPSGQKINYGYDNMSGLENIWATAGGITARNDIGYNKGYITSLTHNGTVYDFRYNGYGDILEVKAAGNILLNKTYDYNANTVETNGITRAYDKYGRFASEKYNGAVKIENMYLDRNDADNSGAKLTWSIDKYAGMEYNYTYDKDDIVSEINAAGNTPWSVSFTKAGRARGADYNVGGSVLNYTYDNSGSDNRLIKEKLDGKFETEYGYDYLGRLKSKTVTRPGGGYNATETYTYKDALNANGTKAGTTGYPASITRSGFGRTDYTYDRNGNITGITSPDGTVTYTYDGLNRLKSETRGGTVTEWEYDAGGNILNKKVNGTVTATYGYGTAANNPWRDRLTSYNGQSITYDSMGNPLNYRGMPMTWTRGGMLQYHSGLNYEYDAQGNRVRMSFSIVERRYWYAGGRLMKETRSENGTVKITIIYYYDADGICGLNYQGVDYYYGKNLQGDITHIYNTAGDLIGAYTYDAWGVCTIVKDTFSIALNNPFRYRGYYYDAETGLYYLQSRYYDPETGRFINADSVGYLDPLMLNGLNLYAYCGNNPVMLSDSAGCSPFSDLWKTIKDVWNGGVQSIVNVVTAPFIWINNNIVQPVGNFFTQTVPDFFVNTVWNGGIVPTWNAASNFFTQTVPNFFVNTVWECGIKHYLWERGIKHYILEKGVKGLLGIDYDSPLFLTLFGGYLSAFGLVAGFICPPLGIFVFGLGMLLVWYQAKKIIEEGS